MRAAQRHRPRTRSGVRARRTWRPRAPTRTAVAAGDDPYRAATGMIVKAYRADWDGTLQPYALYVPRDYKPGRPGGWPLIVALHGAFSDHRHNLRRVFGLDNRPRENDAEASRNELPLPDVPALVVSPFGRGELMGYDGLGGDDVMRVIADVRRAYDVDPERISLTGLSMGGGGTWQIGLRHPELFAALAPVCAVADYRRMVQPPDAPFYDLDALDRRVAGRRWPATPRACRCSSFTAPRTRPCPSRDSRKMVERFRAARLAGQERPLHRVPGRRAQRLDPRVQGRGAAAHAGGDQARSGRARAPPPPPPRVHGDSGPVRQERRRGRGRTSTSTARTARRTRWRPAARWRTRMARLGADGRRAVRGQGRRRGDRRRSRAVLAGAGRGGAAQRAGRRAPAPDARPLGDRAFRAVVARPRAAGPLHVVLGALTPRGFDRLKRFARPNRDGWAPEPNRPSRLVDCWQTAKSVAIVGGSRTILAARAKAMANLKLSPGVITGNALKELFAYCKEVDCALPAVNVIGSQLGERGARSGEARRRRRSSSSSRTPARSSSRASRWTTRQQQASIAGSIAGALHVRTLAKVYGVPVVLHTDHCAKKLLPWVDGVHRRGRGVLREERRAAVQLAHAGPVGAAARREPRDQPRARCSAWRR